MLSVTPQTVGQFTGLLDSTGRKIFEGDIVRWTGDKDMCFEIMYADGSFFGIGLCDWKRISGETLSLNNSSIESTRESSGQG